MKKARLTEEQIVGILQEHEAGAKCADLCRKHKRLGQWADDQAVKSLGQQRNLMRDTIRQGAAVVASFMDANRGKAMAGAAISMGTEIRKQSDKRRKWAAGGQAVNFEPIGRFEGKRSV